MPPLLILSVMNPLTKSLNISHFEKSKYRLVKGGTKETGGLFGLCAGSRAQNQQGDHMSEPSAAPVAAPASMPMARGAPAL